MMTSFEIERKGQITFFIIIGIILITIFLIFFVMLSKTTEEEQAREIEKVTQSSSDIKPLQDFAQSCVELTVKNAFFKLGKQGGMLYDSDGGPVPLAAFSVGKDYLYWPLEQANVQYAIKPYTTGSGGFSHNTPAYPYNGFPLAGQSTLYSGLYGWVNFPALIDMSNPGNLNTINGQLKYYIENNIPKCTKGYENFPSFEVIEGPISSNISYLDNGVSVNVNYPLDIRKKTTDETVHLEEFNVYLDFRMKNLYYFVRDLLHHEAISIIYNMDGKSSGTASVKKIEKDVEGRFDDIVVIEDTSFNLDSRPFRLNLLIDNRPPALHFIDSDNLPVLRENYVIDGNNDDLFIVKNDTGGIIFNFSDSIRQINPELRVYYDPDEGENISVEYSLDLPVTIDYIDVDIGSKNLNIFVTDGEFTDYQEIEFEVAS